ncbi:putative kinesin motor, catalytic domain [Lyophyllum shimeji]|uniref:Kinesin motor, catalytic domain n=1 Tax=Lyophyllum shimeji TaxID=47721 RepID=A0A9P3PF62_LYOSH|nr:putative kinesin motor, catalytic domain [Lyophyllum shimeji]
MAPSSSSSATTTSVQVALRIRPPTTQDSTSIPARFQRSVIHATSSNTVAIEATAATGSGSGAPNAAATASSSSAAKKQLFSFDQVHPPPTTQYELFQSTAKPLVSRFVEGFNCTILAYGQTSSGKTFTMTGMDLDADPTDPNNAMGIIPRAVSHIFSSAKQLKEERGGAWNYTLKGSFIEIYNEDLIDLLTLDEAVGGRREVQIREDKDGHIIWGGLREVNVRNAAEVMSLLRKGTSIRRTNETDMNAQSSRSHAIFSLTLTQKRYTGSTPPPRSSSPLPPGGRSPSRLARPGSMYASPASSSRVGSPTFGRPATPSFAAAMGRGGLRPASALGHAGERSHNLSIDDERGEWVTVTSKFHFVDLAGSERLKRTAAAGERIKEGISINSGLLALGNVISALGDPARAKSNTASHVPYRDSKLTRLLQDSLGGNAHTLMIACVSPAEWNANETVNTLKYANRARNIKNRAVLNEKEEGWDDVEWLQGTITRLRKELKALKEGGGVTMVNEAPQEVAEGASKKVLAQMTELQNNYEDLRAKFVERTEELTRLRRELGEKQRGSAGGAVGGTARYEEIVGPVIEEYEKTIAAMEAELSLNRAALRHTNELVEEKEEELAVITERHAATELYVEELRGRVAKLTERESATEAYIRDLEEKIKSYDETSLTSNESMTDLKREVTRFKDAESSSSKYIAELEARLGRSDESILSLQQTVEKLENECERRRDEVKSLQSRLETLHQDGQNWRTDLEERERRVKELELKMVEWETRKKDASDARIRLGSVVDEIASARKSLEINISQTPRSTPGETPSSSPIDRTPAQGLPLSANGEPPASRDSALENQLLALQQTHTATLSDLSSVTAKYRDALREISDLAAQIQEAKLSNPGSARSESPDKTTLEIPPPRRRMTGGRVRDANDVQYNSAGRRLFFRQAASAESLHARSLSQSQSLSQELSSVHSRKTSFSSHGTSSSHSPSSSHSHTTLSYLSGVRPNLSISLPSTSPINGNERSVSSLEKEIMRLQEVLKEREAEITLLEQSLKESQEQKSAPLAPVPDVADEALSNVNGKPNGPATTLSPKTQNQFDRIRKTMENGNGHTHDTVFEMNGSSVYSEKDESLERLNELMLSMAQKESHHREVVDSLNAQLSQVQRQLDDLSTLSRDQALNMSTEIEGLTREHEEDLARLEEVQKREVALLEALKTAEANHAAEVEQLRSQHQAALEAKGAEVDELTTRLKAEHEDSLASLRDELAKASSALEKSHRHHEESFGKLKAEHEEELRHRLQQANDVLKSTRDEQEQVLHKLHAEHAEVLRQKDAEANAVLQRTEEEYYNALTKLRGDHAEALKKHAAELNATLERVREEHAGELRMAEIAREGSLSESQSAQAAALQELQDAHAAAIARKEASFAEELEVLKADHARTLAMKVDDFDLQTDRLRLEYETTLSKLKEERRVEVDRLHSDLADAKDEAQKDLDAAVRAVTEQHASVLQELERGHKDEIESLKKAYEVALQESRKKSEDENAALLRSHAEEVDNLKAQHRQEVSDIHASIAALREEHRRNIESVQAQSERLLDEEKSRHSQTLATLEEDHRQALETLRSQNQALVDEKDRLSKNLSTAEDDHRESLQASRAHAQLIGEEKERLAASLTEVKEQHAKELSTLRAEHDVALQELASHKVAADEFTLVREQARQLHERELEQKADAVRDLESQLAGVTAERDDFEAEVARLRGELDRTRGEQSRLIQEASKRESLVGELERHRSVIAEMQENLQKVKDENDAMQLEKGRAETLVRDLQAQLARSASPPNARPVPDRNLSYTRATGLPAMKLPPPTPPPSVPPPPAPAPRTPATANGDAPSSITSQGSSATTTVSSRESQPESPSTSIAPNSPSPADLKVLVKLEQQAKQIEEQEAMIKTLNKQLTHCETDLQTHMDLVTTLETSLGDSEKNLRKARMHATELARERDTLNAKIEALRNELAEAKREVVTVRRSIVEEKQSLEQKLDEERKAKERARQQLDSRMDELQKRKSKFACL